MLGEIPEGLGAAASAGIDDGGKPVDLLIERGALEFPKTMETPAAHDHGFDVMCFDLCARMEFGVEARGESGEMFGRFAADNDGFGEEAVFNRVSCGDGFAFGRDWP